VPVPFEEDGRLVGVLAGRLVRDRQLPDIPSLEGLPDRIELDDIRMVLGPGLQERNDLRISVSPIAVIFPYSDK
jgi:hypothetical protein